MNIPPLIQSLIDQGFAYLDADDCVVAYEWCRDMCTNMLKQYQGGYITPGCNVATMEINNLNIYNAPVHVDTIYER